MSTGPRGPTVWVAVLLSTGAPWLVVKASRAYGGQTQFLLTTVKKRKKQDKFILTPLDLEKSDNCELDLDAMAEDKTQPILDTERRRAKKQRTGETVTLS